MSIQPNRILARIVEQVDASSWPALSSRVVWSADGDRWVRIFSEPVREEYATAFHFWVHAMREDLIAKDRREDLVGAAGQALCQELTLGDWNREIGAAFPPEIAPDKDARIYRMVTGSCRPSSVAQVENRLVAHFAGHGPGAKLAQEFDMTRRIAIMLGLFGLIALSGCSDPDRAILDRLDPGEQARFKRGQAAAVPCWTCHDLAGGVKKVGPSLLGIYGRQSGRGTELRGLRRASFSVHRLG